VKVAMPAIRTMPFGSLPRLRPVVSRRRTERPVPLWSGEGFAGPRGGRPLFDEARALREGSALLRDPIWRAEGMASGRHRPVMLIPGFSAGDASMAAFARWLRRAGYVAMASQVHLNVGCSRGTVEHLTARLELAALRQDQPILLIGQSLGGVFARTLATRRPDLVAGVISLGSPHLAPTAAHRILMADVALLTRLSRIGAGRLRLPVAGSAPLMSAECVHGDCAHESWRESRGRFPAAVPFLSIYSRTDGLIDHRACLDPAAEHLEVDSSHCGMALNAEVYRAVATRLPGFYERARGNRT
jgi:triacylglycerol lipase